MRRTRSGVVGGSRSVLVALPLLLAGCASTAVQHNLAETSAFATREVGQEAQLQATTEARATAESKARDTARRTVDRRRRGADRPRLQSDVSTHARGQRGGLRCRNTVCPAAKSDIRLQRPVRGQFQGNRPTSRHLPARFRAAAATPASRRPSAGAASPAQRRRRDCNRDRGAPGMDRRGGGTPVAGLRGAGAKGGVERARNSAVAWRPSATFRASRRRGSRSFYAEATAELARAQLEAQRTREVLIRLLGLSGESRRPI